MHDRQLSSQSAAITAAVLLCLGGFTAAMLHWRGVTANANGIQASAPYTTWTQYGGDNSDSQYSALKQINRSNVNELQKIWFYPAGNNGFRFGSNPIVVHGIMILFGKNNNLAGVDAVTGKELWVHDNSKARLVSHRGVSFWESKDGSDQRIFFCADNHLHALDLKTGKDIPTFGENGAVDLRTGLGRDIDSIRQIQSNTPGRVFENLLIMGSATGEEYDSPPGDLRAFDVLTGKLVWTFHTVPHPGEMGYDTWPPNAWKYIGGTNTWGEISVDEKRGIAYFPLGSPTYDFYAADRHGANLFSDCLLALDARTGKYLWHFQTTHHDLWDYDLETGPKLMTIRHDGKRIDVVVQAGKNGFLYVFDRVTGKPVFPIEEKPVPQSDVEGEASWPTQPIPTQLPPFARQSFKPEDVDPYIADPKERGQIREAVKASRNEGIYTPPSLGTTMEIPGNNGGSNWGSAAIDPESNTFYVVAKNAPSLLHLEAKPPRRQMAGPPEAQGQVVYLQNCAQCHTTSLKGQPPAIPSLVDVVNRVGATQVRTAVHNGLPPMPAFPDLTDKDLDHLIAYLAAPEKSQIPPDVLARIMAPAATPSAVGPRGRRYWTGYGYMNSTEGLPALGPPWSTLTAYDLDKGVMKWQIPYGTVRSLAGKGIKDSGSFWPRGGAVVTAGGLIIAPIKSDNTLHFYDKDTGKPVYELKLPVSPEGIPAVYEVNGREYIVISARPNLDLIGASNLGDVAPTPVGGPAKISPDQGYYVYALPEKGSVVRGQ
jgi:quinoprotein glucose dehydrogenase